MSTVLEIIPPAQVIREQLGANVREARILRKLIKVAEDVEAERSSNPQASEPKREAVNAKA